MDPNANPTPPANPDPANPPANPAPADPPAADPKVHEELGKLKKVEEDYNVYRTQVDPVLQTLYSDPELFNTVLDKHNKRLGIATPPANPDPANPNPAPPVDTDTRQAVLTNTFRDFEKEKGMVALTDDARKDLNGKILGELKDMLDPMGNKTLDQALKDVSLSKLPRFLEKAYDLATKDEQIHAAAEAAKAKTLEESAGIIGSMPSGSVDTSEVGLSAKEKEVARKMNISEEQFLENKKKIMVRNATQD